MVFPPRQVLDRVWIGGHSTATNESFMRENNIGLIVNCTRHVPSPFRDDIATYRIPIDDHPEWKSLFQQHLRIVAQQIHTVLTESHQSVLVHCHAGVSRSATVVGAYLIIYRDFSVDDAIGTIQARKPETFRPSPIFKDILQNIQKQVA